MLIVYLAEWCDCIFESAYNTISVHKTKAGAYKALRKKRLDVFTQERDIYLIYGSILSFDNPLKYTACRITETAIKE